MNYNLIEKKLYGAKTSTSNSDGLFIGTLFDSTIYKLAFLK